MFPPHRSVGWWGMVGEAEGICERVYRRCVLMDEEGWEGGKVDSICNALS